MRIPHYTKPWRPKTIAAIRRDLGMTQQELADVIDVSRSYIQKLEVGGRVCNRPTRMALTLLFEHHHQK